MPNTEKKNKDAFQNAYLDGFDDALLHIIYTILDSFGPEEEKRIIKLLVKRLGKKVK